MKTTIDTSKLKPCPLCGNENLTISSRCFAHGCYQESIECSCGVSYSRYAGNVADGWNDRLVNRFNLSRWAKSMRDQL